MSDFDKNYLRDKSVNINISGLPILYTVDGKSFDLRAGKYISAQEAAGFWARNEDHVSIGINDISIHRFKP